MAILDINFEGFWQCRLATDPDPSDEQRGISGFTYAVVGETLLEPSLWSQPKDILKEYGLKKPAFRDSLISNKQFNTMNIREASPDYAKYNEQGIGIKITGATLDGEPLDELSSKLEGGLVRFAKREAQPNYKWKGPIFEGRNQITSDGDPDRFTVNPFVLTMSDADDNLLLSRFDPLDFNHPDRELWQINPNDPNFDEILERRLPVQRFAMSNELMAQVGIDPNDLSDHFTNRSNWLKSKILEAEANGKEALAESYRSRYFAVEFFTQSTGPTVLSNRLLSRIPLRQLYKHTLRGDKSMEPIPFVDKNFFAPFKIDEEKPWEMMYYLGAYDGDLMAGWCTGTLSLSVKRI
jgi:hypothetical protein